jgi:hypothetical protein
LLISFRHLKKNYSLIIFIYFLIILLSVVMNLLVIRIIFCPRDHGSISYPSSWAIHLKSGKMQEIAQKKYLCPEFWKFLCTLGQNWKFHENDKFRFLQNCPISNLILHGFNCLWVQRYREEINPWSLWKKW